MFNLLRPHICQIFSVSLYLFASLHTFSSCLSFHPSHLYACKQDFPNCAHTSPTNYYHHWVGSMQRYKLNWFTLHNGDCIPTNNNNNYQFCSQIYAWINNWRLIDSILNELWLYVANKYHVNDVTCHFPITIALDVRVSNFKFHVPPIKHYHPNAIHAINSILMHNYRFQ